MIEPVYLVFTIVNQNFYKSIMVNLKKHVKGTQPMKIKTG